EVDHLEKKYYKTAYNQFQALWHLNREKINKYWSKINNLRTPQDLIHRIVNLRTHEIATRSNEMSELAQDYYNNLQTEGLLPYTSEPHQSAILEAMHSIPIFQQLTNPHLSPLDMVITYDTLESSLQAAKLGSAPGPDGLPYKLWNHLHLQHKQALKAHKPPFDVHTNMHVTYNN
ncbi:hypothetical protein V8B97DRAFT_1872876, partial [Scleroderma yunnanense]